MVLTVATQTNGAVGSPCPPKAIPAHNHHGYTYEHMETIARSVLAKTKHRPEIGIICGSGLGSLGDILENQDCISYKDIPDFPVSTVAGHSGRLVFGELEGKIVVCMQGRFHPYEGYPIWKCALPVRVMKLIGVKLLIVTNAAGGVNANFKTGDVMIIKDHISLPALAGDNPLKGHNDERWGPRFPALNNAYCPKLQKLMKTTALELGMKNYLRDGVYCMIGGPTFETAAEIRMLRTIGGDAVGMSTAHEVITAAHCGIRCAGLSLISNECVADYEEHEFANHEEVLEAGAKRRVALEKLVRTFVGKVIV